MAAKLLLVSLLLAGTVLAVQSQSEPNRRIRFRPKIRRTSPTPDTQEDNAISDDLNLSRDEAQQLISKLKQSPSRRTDLPPRRPGFSSRQRPRFRKPQKQPLGRSRVTEAPITVETTTESKRDKFVPRLRNQNPKPFKGQVIGGEVTLDSGIRSQNEQIEVVMFKPTEKTLSNPEFEEENLIEGSGDFASFTKNSLFDSLTQEREDFRERKEERERIDIALATEQPLENSIEIQTTERRPSLQQLFKSPSDRAGGRKATKRRRGRPGARPAESPVARPIAPATQATFIPSDLTEARNTPTTEDPLQALLRRASSLTTSSKAVTKAAKEMIEVEKPRSNEKNEITDRRIGVRRRIPGRSGGRKINKSGRRKVSQSSRDFIRQDRLRLRARVPRPVAKTEDSQDGGSRTRLSLSRPVANTIADQEEGANFSSFPSKLSSSSPRRPAFQPRIRLSQASRNNQETVFSPSQDNLSIKTESIGSIGTIPITEPFSQTVPATEAFRDEIAIATSRPKPTTPFIPLRAEPTARPAPRAQPTSRPQPSVAQERPFTPITRPHTPQITSLGASGELDFQIPLEFDPFSFTTPGTPAVADFTRRPFSSAVATTPAPPTPTRSSAGRVNQRPRVLPEAPRSIQQSVPAVRQPQRAPVQAPRRFANFGAQSETSRRAQSPRRLPVPAQPQAPRPAPVPAQPQAPRRIPAPVLAQAPRRLPAPVPAQAPRRLPVPAQPQQPQRLPFPAQPQAPRRLPVPAPPQAPQRVPVLPQAPSQAAVPAPSGVSGITQLRNNDFASFDRQFGGSVPFTAFTAFRSQTTAPQLASAASAANGNQNIGLLQNQNTVIQPQSPFQPIPQPQRFQPGIQQPQRVVPQNFQFPFQARDQTFNIVGQPQQSFQRFAPQPFRINAAAASQNIQSFAPRPPTPQFQSQLGFQPQQFQFQAAASQNVPVSVRQPLNLAPNTFFGHPASNINLNTGSFSISTK